LGDRAGRQRGRVRPGRRLGRGPRRPRVQGRWNARSHPDGPSRGPRRGKVRRTASGRDVGLGAAPGRRRRRVCRVGGSSTALSERPARGRRSSPRSRLQVAFHVDAWAGLGRAADQSGDETVDGPIGFLVSAGEPFSPGRVRRASASIRTATERNGACMKRKARGRRGDAARRGAQRPAPNALDFDDRVRHDRQPEPRSQSQTRSRRATGRGTAARGSPRRLRRSGPPARSEQWASPWTPARSSRRGSAGSRPRSRRTSAFNRRPLPGRWLPHPARGGAQTAARNPSGGAAHRPRLRRHTSRSASRIDPRYDPSFGERGAGSSSTEVLCRKRRRRAKR
jgi:hypothetical protein